MIPYVGGSFDEAPQHYMKLMPSNRSTAGNHYCFHNECTALGTFFFTSIARFSFSRVWQYSFSNCHQHRRQPTQSKPRVTRVNKSGFNFWANPRQERRPREHDTYTFGTNNNTKNKTESAADSSTCCTRMTVIIKSFHHSIMRVVNWSQHQKINCSSFHHSIIRLVSYLSHPTSQHKTICSYSHSTVAGGLDVMSWQTRFMPRTLLQILFTTSTRNAWSK